MTAAVLSLLLATPAPLPAQSPRPAAPRPSLVVILVVDQMRADYIDRYGHMWTRGLRRLIDHGAWFRLGAYPYWNTITCAGHATIGTGTLPPTHGMILNAWWDRARGRQVDCTQDFDTKAVSYGAPFERGDSGATLLMPTLADELRAQLGSTTRVVSLSLKQRSAIGLAGHGGDAVTWFEAAPGAWITSTYFTREPVPAVREFIRANPVESDLGQVWTRLLPEEKYLFTDDAPGEKPPAYWQKTFPHPLSRSTDRPDSTFYSAWRKSPYSDAYMARMAAALVDEWKLGQGQGTDFLGVSFSALDLVGHDYGPQSHEVQDVLARLDATIGTLLDHLNRKVGAGNYVLALSADHGVALVPEQAQAAGLPAGRIPNREVAQAVEKALEPHLGPGPHVARHNYTDVYFQPGVYAKLRENAAAMRAVQEAILSLPGIWRVYRGDDLVEQRGSADSATRAAALSYYAGRSGDLIVLTRPYWFGSTDATTHGSGHAYDQRVPIILMGRGIRSGEYLTAATPADIAPTLAFLSGVTLPRAEGRVLTEALAPRPAPAQPAKKKP